MLQLVFSKKFVPKHVFAKNMFIKSVNSVMRVLVAICAGNKFFFIYTLLLGLIQPSPHPTPYVATDGRQVAMADKNSSLYKISCY